MDHTFGGPPEGHDFARPVSLETPVRSGPRHCGHSSELLASAEAPRGKRGAASNGKKFLRFMRKVPQLRPSGLLSARFSRRYDDGAFDRRNHLKSTTGTNLMKRNANSLLR